jgi:hypothetical protein
MSEATPMLAEKFILLLETLMRETRMSHSHPDGSPRVESTSPHVPIQLPPESANQAAQCSPVSAGRHR